VQREIYAAAESQCGQPQPKQASASHLADKFAYGFVGRFRGLRRCRLKKSRSSLNSASARNDFRQREPLIHPVATSVIG